MLSQPGDIYKDSHALGGPLHQMHDAGQYDGSNQQTLETPPGKQVHGDQTVFIYLRVCERVRPLGEHGGNHA